MTSFTWTSRHARTQRLHWMQASSATRIAGWEESGAGGAARAGKRLPPSRPTRSVQVQKRESCSRARSRGGWSARSSSNTVRRECRARSVSVRTFMPGAGRRMQAAARTRSPSTSTMQARQLPSGR